MTPTQLIRIDWIGGLVAGVVMLVFHRWLSDFYRVPASVVLGVAAINLAYGTASLTLATRARDGFVPGLGKMGAANLCWAVCCVVLVIVWTGRASAFGLAHFALEGTFVAGLGSLERRAHRRQVPSRLPDGRMV